MASADRPGEASTGQVIERLKDLIAKNFLESERLQTKFRVFLREVGQAVSAGRAGERPGAEALLSRWLDFNVAAYSAVSKHSLELANELLSTAQRTLMTQAAPVSGTRAGAVPRVELKLSGRHGERAATRFVIENHFDGPLDVTFEATALVPTTGPELPSSLLNFEPSTLAIAPGGQGVFQVAITITADFVAGQTYSTTIRPSGFEAKELGLSLTVLPSEKDPSN